VSAPTMREQLLRRAPVSAMVAETGAEDGGEGQLARRIGPLQLGYPVVSVLSVLCCLYLIPGLSGTTFALFAGWLLLAAIVHVTYTRTHSKLRSPLR